VMPLNNISECAETSGSFIPVMSGFGASMTAKKSAAAPAAADMAMMGAAVCERLKAIIITDMRTITIDPTSSMWC
jgi:hypothetical protein